MNADTDPVTDPVVTPLLATARADASIIGLLLHGSRAAGTARSDSDYDYDLIMIMIMIRSDESYTARREAGRLFERRPEGNVDILYQSPGRLAWLAEHPGWYTSTYFGMRVLLDKTGAVAARLTAIQDAANARAVESVEDYYDKYLTAFARSLKCWRRREVLG